MTSSTSAFDALPLVGACRRVLTVKYRFALRCRLFTQAVAGLSMLLRLNARPSLMPRSCVVGLMCCAQTWGKAEGHLRRNSTAAAVPVGACAELSFAPFGVEAGSPSD